jgi:hypothetical protein
MTGRDCKHRVVIVRAVVLGWVASRFAPARDYPEAEVNRLPRHHRDFAVPRRYLVDRRPLGRTGGIYRRASQSFR